MAISATCNHVAVCEPHKTLIYTIKSGKNIKIIDFRLWLAPNFKFGYF